MKQNRTSIHAPMEPQDRISATERRATIALAGIFFLRMLGLFMILPVLALYAERYIGYTATLAGLAIGIYGLTQAMFQVPFGILSDRVGRRPVIVGGLLIFALGSLVAALSDTMLGLIIGRALQGMGAIAAAIMALAADLTREEQRTKAMAVIGASIGLAFMLALISGPALTQLTGLSGLFVLTAVLALAGIVVLYLFVPKPITTRFHRDTEPVVGQFARVLRDPQLLRLDAGILILHLILTASFVVVPLLLRDYGGLGGGQHWQIYLLVLSLSVALMIPFILLGERYRRTKQVFVGAVLVLGISQLGLLALHHALWEIVALMVVFFTAFNILEANLPSLISRLSPSEMKGTALGVYSTAQFLGAFLGGASGGWLYDHHGAAAVFGFCAVLAGLWFVFASTMRNPQMLTSHLVRLGDITAEEAPKVARQLSAIAGVAEAVVIVEDGIAYLKVDRKILDQQALRAFTVAEA